MELIGMYCEGDRYTLSHSVVKGRVRHVTARGTYSNHWALNGCHLPGRTEDRYSKPHQDSQSPVRGLNSGLPGYKCQCSAICGDNRRHPIDLKQIT